MKIIAVGVGSYNLDELTKIASEPKSQNVFTAESYATLIHLKDALAVQACQGKRGKRGKKGKIM